MIEWLRNVVLVTSANQAAVPVVMPFGLEGLLLVAPLAQHHQLVDLGESLLLDWGELLGGLIDGLARLLGRLGGRDPGFPGVLDLLVLRLQRRCVTHARHRGELGVGHQVLGHPRHGSGTPRCAGGRRPALARQHPAGGLPVAGLGTALHVDGHDTVAYRGRDGGVACQPLQTKQGRWLPARRRLRRRRPGGGRAPDPRPVAAGHVGHGHASRGSAQGGTGLSARSGSRASGSRASGSRSSGNRF